MGDVILIRHGQTEWSANGRHTSSTDLDLTAEGEAEAAALGAAVAGRRFAVVLSSPRLRARRTAELAGLPVTSATEDLAEWDYGEYEGVTTADIHRTRPDWSLWTDGAPGGESPEQIGARIDRVLDGVRSIVDTGDVAVIGHGHASRVLAARWLGLPVAAGALFTLDSGALSVLGFEHARPVLERWNLASR
jgi:probable phosphoglycerate mutase